ncbi:class I SAM-dependent DNA methyltransferase [Actinokineospora globicatena]|uniref:class I SAM-dependent DNA methyltransferase n=1 Tax=Actinokineospora globicatena TaxID=103729 RepID=UPI0020A43506|nr:class I SAM-dependent methyltransferase [Actinokineospora globicatena]MCP2305976.1 Methyltransferase domain-containing protein [Actinokineospora globicatena]GLW80153.1 methyltransferase [Actinokineospora globicatena]GLW86982.1 methyltransferase [Actinokineospora globicatena]
MEHYGPETYGELNADVYDEWHAGLDPTDAVRCLAELIEQGPAGPVLELAVGTGRVTIPLAAHGVDLRGIDASAAMVDRMRAKPGGDRIPVALGDMADVDPGTDDRFAMVFVVFSTFFFLMTQDDQVRCFANVAERLLPGGRFVLECPVPDVARYQRNQSVDVHDVGLDHVRLVTVRHDPVGQRFDGHHVLIGTGGIRLAPVSMRYAWPTELDLMARLAGLELRHRWGGWHREPFRGEGMYVTVYEKPA